MSLLSVNSVTKSFGGNRAVDDVTLDIIPNRINLLIGSNGCGKTTLVNAISGNTKVDSGSIIYRGDDITQKSIHYRFSVGITRTYQTPRLFSNLSVLENLMMAHRNEGESFGSALLLRHKGQEDAIRKKALDVLDSLDLSGLQNRLAYDLSGGQIKLLEIAKTMMGSPGTVLLDEPIAGIAPKLAHRIFGIISKVCRDQGTTFLIIEHRLDIALRYADWVFVMNQGKIIAQDYPDKILHNKTVIDSYLR